MATTPFRPTSELFGSLTENMFGPAWGGRLAGMDVMRNPQADVIESNDQIDVVLELPGLRPDDVEVSLENNILTIAGEKKEERREDDQDRRWHLSERRYGRFSRSFILPRDVEQERIAAHFENGLLRISIPKSERARPRRIEVQGANGHQAVETHTTG
jgi:HSP20 family protein